MARKKLTPEQMERALADMLNAAHHYQLESATGTPFVPSSSVSKPYACCAIGAAALISCPVEEAMKDAYKCASDTLYGAPEIGDTYTLANSAMYHANDSYPSQDEYYRDGDNADAWELGWMFREAMVAPDKPVAQPAQLDKPTGCF